VKFILVFLLLLSGCATAPVTTSAATRLLKDELFAKSNIPIDAKMVFAPSDEMKRYVRTEIAAQAEKKGEKQGLFDALYDAGQLKLQYDSELTRNAAETFAARSGNCLSLAIMTGAFAKEMGMSVRFQRIAVDENWSRNQNMFFASGHVNVVLTTRAGRAWPPSNESHSLTIDFFPPGELRGQRAQTIGENTITAMYMNNRAAEALVRGQVDDAYAWAREAVLQDAEFLASYNTLGVLYRRRGDFSGAEAAFSHVLTYDAENLSALSNLSLVLRDQRRFVDAELFAARLERVQPHSPYYFYDQAQAAMHRADYVAAKALFAREVKRAEYNPDFQFGLASALFQLGEFDRANTHLRLARDTSTTRKEHELYSAKLDRLALYRKQKGTLTAE
jgi:Flp pilus assembly protein TadD